MTKIIRVKPAGFTLIETVVAIFGFTIIFTGLVALVSNIFLSSSQQAGLLSDSDQARRLAFSIVTELRNAQTSNTGAYALGTTEAQQLVFYSNIDSDSNIERLRYFVQDGKLYKGTVEPTGNPLNYDLNTEKIQVVQNNLANGAAAVFNYFDGSYVGGAAQTPLVQPVSTSLVKFVEVNLQILNKAGKEGTNSYNVTASGAVRNLKNNLGN